MTHTRNGVYATMYIAAAIAAAPVYDEALAVHRCALRHIPQQSRLAEAVRAGIAACERSRDWEEAYRLVNEQYGEFGHCRVYQEVADLVISLHFTPPLHCDEPMAQRQ